MVECPFKSAGCNKINCISTSLGKTMPLPCEMEAVLDATFLMLGASSEAEIQNNALQDGRDVIKYMAAVNESIQTKKDIAKHGRPVAFGRKQDRTGRSKKGESN